MNSKRRRGRAAAPWLALGLSIAAVACQAQPPGNPEAYQGSVYGESANECSSTFVSEYNSVMTAVGYVREDGQRLDQPYYLGLLRDDATRASELASEFKARFGGVQCVALLDGKRTTVDASAKMDQVVSVMNDILGALSRSGIRAEPDAISPESRVELQLETGSFGSLSAQE